MSFICPSLYGHEHKNKITTSICYFQIVHITLCLPPQNLRKHCLQFLLGLKIGPGKAELGGGEGGLQAPSSQFKAKNKIDFLGKHAPSPPRSFHLWHLLFSPTPPPPPPK